MKTKMERIVLAVVFSVSSRIINRRYRDMAAQILRTNMDILFLGTSSWYLTAGERRSGNVSTRAAWAL
jgi:hypothetical protein